MFNAKMFFNIKYEAINIYGVKIAGELKFFTSIEKHNGKIYFAKPNEMSNWVNTPEIIDVNE